MEDIVIRSLCKAFDGKPVLQGFSATLPAGRVSCIMAPSGGGKTTLLRILLGLEAADSGEICGLAGLRLSAVFQEDRLLENLSPVANIRLVNPRRPRGEVLAALAAVRLSGCADQPARELSGRDAAGAWRSCARCWPEWDVLLLDEPFKGLDEETKACVLAFVRRAVEGRTAVLVTHDATEARALGAAQILTL